MRVFSNRRNEGIVLFSKNIFSFNGKKGKRKKNKYTLQVPRAALERKKKEKGKKVFSVNDL